MTAQLTAPGTYYGSWPGDYRRVLYFRHAIINRLLTLWVCLITDVNFSDIETCYKAIHTRLFQSIPIRRHKFNLEPEICIKLAKRGASIFEVPISYAGRTKEEGITPYISPT